MQVGIALTGHGALAPEVERSQGVRLARVRHSHRHAVLRMDRGIGSGRLHASELDRGPCVFIEVRKYVGYRHRIRRILERGAHTHHAR